MVPVHLFCFLNHPIHLPIICYVMTCGDVMSDFNVFNFINFWLEIWRGNIVICFRDGMVCLGSIEFISLRKPTPSTLLIGHMSWIKYFAMNLVISLKRFEGRGRDVEVSYWTFAWARHGELLTYVGWGWLCSRCIYLQSLHTAWSFMISLGASFFFFIILKIIFQNRKYFHTVKGY